MKNFIKRLVRKIEDFLKKLFKKEKDNVPPDDFYPLF